MCSVDGQMLQVVDMVYIDYESQALISGVGGELLYSIYRDTVPRDLLLKRKLALAKKITVDGRCHCGSIEVTAQVDPGMVLVCHCTDCQMISGGPYRAVAISDAEDFSITGTPSEYIKVAESDNNGFRHSVVTWYTAIRM